MISRRQFLTIGGLSLTAFGFVDRILAQSGEKLLPKIKKMVEAIEPLTKTDYEMRREKARQFMAERGISALFLTASTNLVYFTGVQWRRSERTFGALLSRKKEPIWVCPAFELERARELIPPDQEVRTWEEHESPYKLIAGIMKDLGAATGKLALGPTIRMFVYFGLRRDAAHLEVVNGAPITEGCRGVKTPKEIKYMDLANRITKLAYQEGFKHLHQGMSQQELADYVRQAHQQMGVSGGGWPQYGPNTAFPHGSRQLRSLKKGDIVLIDGGCSVAGYRSDVTRTIVFGQPTARQRQIWKIVRKAQQAAYHTIRPGVPCEEVDRAARRVIEEAGFGPDYKYFGHRLGHGIGLEGHEYPYLVRGNKLPIQPGMTFSNEPGIYIYGEFGVRIEDCFVVTEDGYQVLGGMEAVAIDQPFA
ncbi:MAG: hypothetical protein B5M54_10925 [Candidatus Aminicenantes bacterium 4484_214]|nr:MAG: hypothetical protein B5M54_10925 [Candidatus Aminicenantes bacterium 4484_214]